MNGDDRCKIGVGASRENGRETCRVVDEIFLICVGFREKNKVDDFRGGSRIDEG